MTQMDLIDIYRIFHPNIKEYTLFSAPHRNFSKIDNVLDNKANLNGYKIIGLYLIGPPWLKTRFQQQH